MLLSKARQLVARPRLVRSFSVSDAGVTPDVVIERLTGDQEGIVTLTLDRPEAKNALGQRMVKEFNEALDALRFDASARVLILQSNVPRVFCAGADLKERLQMSQQEAAAATFGFRSLFTQLEKMPMPTIAAIEGAALGGGLEMALACDFRIAGTKSILGAPETGLAIIPGAGGTQRLPRLIGASKAKELTFTARRINSTDAESIGLVDYSVPEGTSFDKALELGQEILPQGPIAIRMAKEAIMNGMETDITTGMAIERACYAQIIPTKDRIEGLQAFREKRKPVYKGE